MKKPNARDKRRQAKAPALLSMVRRGTDGQMSVEIPPQLLKGFSTGARVWFQVRPVKERPLAREIVVSRHPTGPRTGKRHSTRLRRSRLSRRWAASARCWGERISQRRRPVTGPHQARKHPA